MKSYSWGNVVNSMPTTEPWVRHSDALAAIEQAQQWQLAVDQLLSGWHSTADSYGTPHDAIKALIVFEVMAALDPKVSSDAAILVEHGRREEREAIIALCHKVCMSHEATLFEKAIRARGEAK